MRRIHILGAIGLVAVLGLGIAAGSHRQGKQVEADTRPVVKIAYLPTTHSLALLEQAKLEEKNPDYHIELVKYGSWPDLSDALNSGQVDGAVELTQLAMKANANGIPLKAVALGHRDGNIVVTDKSITSVEQLKGKSFAIPSKLSSHNILLKLMLEKNGLKLDDLNVIELSPSEMPFALVSGQIAGYCVAEPFGGKAVNAKVANVLYESGDLWEDSICCALVFQESFLKRSIADKVIEDYQKAGAYLDKHKEEAEKTGVTYLSVDRDVLKVSLQWISFENLTIEEGAYEALCDRMVQYQVMETPPSYDTFIAETYREAGVAIQ